jgi:hypothetical protein
MILNSYAILIGFLALLQLAASGVALLAGGFAWRRSMRSLAAEERTALEQRYYLVFLLTLLLLGINLLSWPLYYLLLQSYVPQWSGVMCIYGVTQVGKGSAGPSRHLPSLLAFLQIATPLLVFLSGAWFALYHLNRRTQTAPLLCRILFLLIPLGALAAADAAAELAYIGIPKKEEFPTSGCCTAAFEPTTTAGYSSRGLLGDDHAVLFGGAYAVVNLGLLAALWACTKFVKNAQRGVVLAPLLMLGLITAAVSAAFLVDVAAPALLKLPFHHCPYDLLPQAPEAVLAIVYFAGGCFFLGWAAVVRWAGRSAETEPFLDGTVRRLLRASFWSYLLSLVMMTLELALA